MSRRLARELALKALFAVDLGRIKLDRILEYLLAETALPPKDAQFARDLAAGTLAHLEECDRLISRQAVGWTIDRMATIDRNILRMALYEIQYRDDIPESVTVNEAVELAKRYGDAESGKFVNGILGEIVRARASLKG
ncbi:MAG: transcription antitermination factor NusB [Firmicutes bacterium]|nr:transcription antitermination factor NusB [Bacillota bacterium]